MPPALWNRQWNNTNSQRSYPIADWGNKEDVTGTIRIPDSLLLSLYLPVHGGLDVEPDKFYIQSLGIYPQGINITVGYDDSTADPPAVASVNVAKSTHTEFRSYALPGVDDFDDTVGKVVIGKLDEVDRLPPGLYTFLPAATPLESDCIRPIIRGISSITVVNGADRSVPVYGDVELVARENMRISVSLVSGQPPQVLFSAIRGEGLNEECACVDEDEGDGIRFINGIPPLPDGNYRVVGDACLDVSPIPNGIKLTDTCSQPCCGCEELTALTQQLDRFADGVTTLQNFVGNLSATVTQMTNVVLGSRLGDQGCVEC